jgi:hypothetical protein
LVVKKVGERLAMSGQIWKERFNLKKLNEGEVKKI